MLLPTLADLDAAAEQVYEYMLPSAQINWPLLSQRCGCEVWVKHENHNPTGAFKVRGGITYLSSLLRREPGLRGVVTATRGNHGQSVAHAAGLHGIRAVVVVPEGNNPEKNAAMEALGAEVIIHGHDFDEAVPHAQQLAREQHLYPMPSFHMDLVCGVASYSLELLRAKPALERVYVPIGLGSGICGMICARNALGLKTEIVGVVSDAADCYARSLESGQVTVTQSANTLADGMAVRTPSDEALQIMLPNLARIVRVSDDQVLAAVGHYFRDTHNIAEGAGAAGLAALIHEREQNRGKAVGVILSGGNIDAALYRRALA
jgi:threonine dehydratase